MAARSELFMQTLSLALMLVTSLPVQETKVEGITFSSRPSEIFIPVREAANQLGWTATWDSDNKKLFVQGMEVSPSGRLYDGTILLDVSALRTLGASVVWNPETKAREVRAVESTFTLIPGEKNVYVSQKDLELRAYQGQHLIISSRASVGRKGFETPNGRFQAGPYKAKMHYSTLYENAPMPWSVQVTGDVFIHGWHGRVGYANSHGCIRLPVDGENPAEFFYNWVDLGTPVTVAESWPEVLP